MRLPTSIAVPGSYWWALILEERTTATHLLIASGLYLVAIANLVRRRTTRIDR